MTKTNTKRLVVTAMLLAVATVLTIISGYIPFQLPFGGSITIVSMLPIVMIAYRYGTKWGLFSGFIFALIQMLTGFKTVAAFFMPGEDQMVFWMAILVCLFDYILAFTVLGFAGVVRNRFSSASVAMCVGAVIAIALRFLCHTISGALFFGSYAEWFFTQESIASFGNWVLENFSGASLAWFYSFVYNATYMIPEMILTAIAAVIVGRVPMFSKKAA